MIARHNNIWLETYQAQKLNNIILGYDDMEPPYLQGKGINPLCRHEEGVSENMLPYLDVWTPSKVELEINQKGQKFYASCTNSTFFKNLPSLIPLYEVNEIETNKNKTKQNPDKRRKPNLFKVKKMLNKKTERSPSPKVKYTTNIAAKKQVSEFNSPVKISKEKIKENVDPHLKITRKEKDVESNKICTQEMSNKSTESSSELNGNNLSRKSHQDSIRAKKDAEFIFHLGEAHNQLKSINKNIEENNLIENLKIFLKRKKFTHILDIKIANKSEEAKRSSEMSLLDYFDKLISELPLVIKKVDKDTILKRLYDYIEICKNKEEKNDNVNKICNELNQSSDSEIDEQDDDDNSDEDEQDIKKYNIKGNLVNVIVNWIKKCFKEDFEEISKMKLEKKEKNKSEGKVNKKKESNLDFFKSNFESFVEEHDLILIEKARGKKKVIFDYLIKIKQEKDPINYLKKMQKLDYLGKIKKAKFKKFLERDKIEQIIKYKNKKCRKEILKIYKSKNLKNLLFLCDQFYRDKGISIKIRDTKDFENEIRKLEEYKDFKLELSQRENDDIQDRLRKFEEIVENPLRCLTESGFKNNNSK